MPRKKLVAANWKMFKTADQTRDFFRDFLPLVQDHSRDEIVVCPPFVDIPVAVESARGSNVSVGGQNMYWEKEGAFTGEISAGMLVALGVTHVIIGHSERRQYFGETDDTVNLKLKVRRNGRHGKSQAQGCSRCRAYTHRLRWRGIGRARSEPDGRRATPAVSARLPRHFWQEGCEFSSRLRTSMGNRDGQNCYSPNGR